MLDVPDPDWYLYDEYEYIGKMDTVDTQSVHISEINKVASNPRYSRHYDTSHPCYVCGNTGITFDECEILFKTQLLESTLYPIFTIH